jgi:hypothetical protein
MALGRLCRATRLDGPTYGIASAIFRDQAAFNKDRQDLMGATGVDLATVGHAKSGSVAEGEGFEPSIRLIDV